MSINYRALEKGQPGVPGGGVARFYASIVRGKRVTTEKLVAEISELNTVNEADAFAVISSLYQILVRHAADGRTVEMGQLGHFIPSIQSTSEDTREEVDKNSIKRFKFNFQPSVKLKKALAQMEFEKVRNGAVVPMEPEPPEEPVAA